MKEKKRENSTLLWINKLFRLNDLNSYNFYYDFIINYLYVVNKSNILNEISINKIKVLNYNTREESLTSIDVIDYLKSKPTKKDYKKYLDKKKKKNN
jgi:hypothetical protein